MGERNEEGTSVGGVIEWGGRSDGEGGEEGRRREGRREERERKE